MPPKANMNSLFEISAYNHDWSRIIGSCWHTGSCCRLIGWTTEGGWKLPTFVTIGSFRKYAPTKSFFYWGTNNNHSLELTSSNHGQVLRQPLRGGWVKQHGNDKSLVCATKCVLTQRFVCLSTEWTLCLSVHQIWSVLSICLLVCHVNTLISWLVLTLNRSWFAKPGSFSCWIIILSYSVFAGLSILSLVVNLYAISTEVLRDLTPTNNSYKDPRTE